MELDGGDRRHRRGNAMNDAVEAEAYQEWARKIKYSSEAATPAVGGNNSKPKLVFVDYDLTPRNYLKYWSQYKVVYEDTSLIAEEKFRYLQSESKR